MEEQTALLEPIAPPLIEDARPPDEVLYGRWLFTVHGRAVPQGSFKPVLSATTGRPFLKVSNETALKHWRKLVADTAMASCPAWLREPWDGPIFTHYVYVFERSPNDYLVDGASLRKGARRYPDTAPDKDKLDRAMNDALTGIAFTNDGRIVAGPSEKRWGAPGEADHVEVEVGFLRS